MNHSVLPNDRLGIFEHMVKRGMRDADIHIVLIDKIRDLLRLNRAYTRNLNRIYSDGIEIGKGLFGILVIFDIVAQSIKLRAFSTDYYIIAARKFQVNLQKKHGLASFADG